MSWCVRSLCYGWLVMLVMYGTASADLRPAPYDAQDRRDPFEALITPTGQMRAARTGSAVGTLQLEGIMWDPRAPLAIVNGEIYRVGDEVAGYRITQIRADALVVETGGQEPLVVPLVPEEME